MKKVVWFWFSLFLAGLLLAGCARATPTPKPTAAPTPVPTTVATPAPTPVAAPPLAPSPTPVVAAPTLPPRPKPEGILRFGRSAYGPEGVDPYVVGDTGLNQAVLVFDFLVGVTPEEKDISADTGLAYKWEVSPDGLAWTFYLRKGVQFDKGYGEATAEDVKFSLERDMGGGSRNSIALQLKPIISTIEVVDPYRLKISLKAPLAVLPYNLSAMIGAAGGVKPKKYIEKVGDKGFATDPIGSGPYRLVKHEPGLYYKFEAREDYWAGTPRFRDLYLFMVPEEATRIAMLKRGELDIAEASIARLEELETAGFKVYAKEGIQNIVGSIHNQWEGVNASKKVREALNLAVNRKEMLASLFKGRGRPLDVRYSWAMGYKPFEPYPYNPQRAKELLVEAGYPGGFELTMMAITKDPAPILSQAVAGYLGAIGIKTKIISIDMAPWQDAWNQGKLKDTLSVWMTGNRLFSHTVYRSVFHKAGYVALTRDPELTALVEKAEQSPSLEKVAENTYAVMRYTYENFSDQALVEIGEYYAASPKLPIPAWHVGGKTGYLIGLNQLAVRR